ncbi:unnamed protein product, partial [Protopolystoma xenopodis]
MASFPQHDPVKHQDMNDSFSSLLYGISVLCILPLASFLAVLCYLTGRRRVKSLTTRRQLKTSPVVTFSNPANGYKSPPLGYPRICSLPMSHITQHRLPSLGPESLGSTYNSPSARAYTGNLSRDISGCQVICNNLGHRAADSSAGSLVSGLDLSPGQDVKTESGLESLASSKMATLFRGFAANTLNSAELPSPSGRLAGF